MTETTTNVQLSAADRMRQWEERVAADHAASIERGEHDRHCEYLHRPGYFLCHCSKRQREAAGLTGDPGDFLWRNPLCPRCVWEMQFDRDGGFDCHTCKGMWGSDGEFIGYSDDHGDLPRVLDGVLLETAEVPA